MFPNVRLMAASTLVSIVALFLAFGVYASLRISHEPLARPARSAPLQLVGLNVAMLPITVLEPFAKHSGPVMADGSSVLAYSGAQANQPPLPVTSAGDAHEDNVAADAPTENNDVTKTNSDVTQIPDTASLEAARETKSPPEAMRDTAAPAAILPPSVMESAALPAPSETAASPAPMENAAVPPPPVAAPPTAAPQNSPVERTAVIETIPAASADDTALDNEVPVKDKKKKRAAKRHLYRVPPRAVAQTSTPQATSYPAAIGGPFVSAKGH
jgi:hypothetical protein